MLFTQGYENLGSEPLSVKQIVKLLDKYIVKYSKIPTFVCLSKDWPGCETEVPVEVRLNQYVRPHQVFIGHDDNKLGIVKGIEEVTFRFASDRTESVIEPIIEATPPSTPKRRGKPVYAKINGMPSMMFNNKHEACEYFGVTISSININISDNSKSGGLLKIDGAKVKLDWSYYE